MENYYLVVKNDPENVARQVANDLVKLINSTLLEKDFFTIALSGGSTPNILYDLLAQEPYKSTIPWKRVFIFQVDERWVARGNKENNFTVLYDKLIRYVDLPDENIYPMPVVKLSYHQATDSYNKSLQNVFQVNKSNVPIFDLILLGMGEDGHTASIFPGKAGEKPLQSNEWVMTVYVDKLEMYRMTLTANVIKQAKNVWVLVTGENKADPLSKVLFSPIDEQNYPIQFLGSINDKVKYYLDKNVISKLNNVKYQ